MSGLIIVMFQSHAHPVILDISKQVCTALYSLCELFNYLQIAWFTQRSTLHFRHCTLCELFNYLQIAWFTQRSTLHCTLCELFNCLQIAWFTQRSTLHCTLCVNCSTVYRLLGLLINSAFQTLVALCDVVFVCCCHMVPRTGSGTLMCPDLFVAAPCGPGQSRFPLSLHFPTL